MNHTKTEKAWVLLLLAMFLGMFAMPSDATYNTPVTTTQVASVDANGLAPLLAIRKAFTLSASTDQAIYSTNAPFAFRVLDATLYVSTSQALSTIEVRNATGGGGSALSDTFVTTTTGELRLSSRTVTSTVAAGGTVSVWRPSGGAGSVVGEVVLLIAKE